MPQATIFEKPEEKRFTLVELKTEIQKGLNSANKDELFEIEEVFEPFLGKANSK